MGHQLTEVIQIDPHLPQQTVIEHAARLLQTAELVVFPTETVYGLGANAWQPQAVQGIFAAKERPFSDPLIVHIASLDALETLVSTVPAVAQRLAHAFWPGPLTLILPASSRVPSVVTAGLETVAVRMPRHPVALALLQASGLPIAAPSANRFMHVSPTRAEHALNDLQGRVPLILDAGPCAVGVESTVLDLCAPLPTILRPGGLSLEALRTIVPEVQPPQPRNLKSEHEGEGQRSPGQMLIHYAPTVPTFLFEGTVAAMQTAMLAETEHAHAQGEHIGVLVADEDVALFQHSGASIYTLGKTLEEVASRLFAGLRTLEEVGVQRIFCRSFPEEGLGLAINDRLRKAAGGKVRTV